MKFCEKLQQLRKQKGLTQEQLAEKMFVSRTAVSKWESGKGYPNLDSLKYLSEIFSVSIDDLLSGEELISLAETENRTNIRNTLRVVFGILDVMALAFIFLPLYGQKQDGFIQLVNLFAYQDTADFIRVAYFLVLILMALVGVTELVVRNEDNGKVLRGGMVLSIFLQTIAIMVFILTQQPYVTFLLFAFMMIKVVLLIKSYRKQ
jgi:transcriptional regulator with XRE-family HTH domain